MITNAYLHKKIVSSDGEIIGYSQERIPLCLIANGNARYQSISIADGVKNNQFSKVYATIANLTNSNATKIEEDDQIEDLITKEKVIVSYVELSAKKTSQNGAIYFIGCK